MADWKSLPDTLDPDVRNLVEQLRRYKDRSGLSLAALAERTLHSKSSWERYLNGKALPPRQAVESLGRAVDADSARLAALWELAERAWSGREAPGRRAPADSPASTVATPPEAMSPEATPPEATPPVGRAPARRTLLTAASILAVLALGAAAVWWWGPDDEARPLSASPSHSAAGELYTHCFQESCAGKDPKEMGCAGDAWTSALTRFHGVYVELRYSDSCKAAWSRISWGHPGDIAKVVAAEHASYQDKVHYDTDIYSPMVASATPSEARACTVLTSGAHDCTKPGGSAHLTEAPEPPASDTPPGTVRTHA
ncbi:DUF2690 domain-containing protein [Streptomyces sp. NPDC059590]|uniref:DUF2690 domain-containing protein n=1 Tax=Streptomyces sp. NPDC059590 TaxID=3346877 RepID=UPI0036941D16